MAGEVIASNALLFETAQFIRDKLNHAQMALKLFMNDFMPTPKDTRNSFTEPGYPGYASISLLGKWRLTRKVKDGEYAFRSDPQTFVTSGPSNTKVYGWWIADAKDVYASAVLPFPYLMTSGSLLTVQAEMQAWATVLLKEK